MVRRHGVSNMFLPRARPLFSIFCTWRGEGGRSVSVASGQSPVRSETTSLLSWGGQRPCRNLYRPYGTRYNFPLYPVLKRWAKLFRAYGACFRAVCSTCRAGPWVATQFRQLGAPLDCHADPATREKAKV